MMLQQCQHYFNSHIDLLASVDGPCIIHRDFRPGNIIVHAGKIQGIIDWASARASFAEEDFCSLELGKWSSHLHYKKFFLAGYANIRPIPDYRMVMSLLQLNRILAIIGFTVKRGTWDSSHHRLYKKYRQFLEDFLSKF